MIDPEEYRETFEKLQLLEQGKMQRLGDELLPGIFPALVGLKSQGLNLEGKTRKGVPDSFVGRTPQTARAAVEYTTQLKDLDQKLLKDFSGVRKSCPAASTIVLCTNRSTEDLDLTGIREEAQKASVHLEIVDGQRLAELLCTHRQDLRKAFLGISIGAHTMTSLIHAMREHLVTMVQGRTTSGALKQFIPRTGLDPQIVQRAKRGAGFMLLRASAGMGKTTWSVEHAFRYSFVEPIAWMKATDLMSQSADPISEQIVMSAYGAPDPARIPELADLLRREGRLVRVFIDAIDEAIDYGRLGRQFRTFRGSVLAKSALVIMLCREHAARLLLETLVEILPELLTQDATLTLRELNEGESELLLRKLGADSKEIRELQAHLPARYAGNPLFLVHVLRLQQAGELESAGEDLIPAISEHFVKDVRDRLKKDGRAPSLSRIRSVLGELALRALEHGKDVLDPGEIEALTGEQEEGENTLLSRAEQTGLLVQMGDDRIGFSHPLFFEYFAAQAIGRKSAELQRELLSRGGSGREVLFRIIGSVQDPLPLLRFMLERDPVGACEAATRLKVIVDEALSERLLEIVRGLLSSRFPSDVTRGLQLLGKLPVPGGRQLAVDWFNGLSAENRQRWLTEAAELFLSLKAEGAADIILHHGGFLFPDDFPWYEPAFVQRVRALPARMKAVLGQRARQQLGSATNESRRARLVHVLATLGDVRLIPHLRQRVAAGALTKGEHRALILLNTREAILLYAESADMCLRREEQAEEPPGSARDDVSEENWWYRCVLKQADIVMYPHDQLVELVACALESEDARNITFGLDWADTLQSPELIERYSSATYRGYGLLGRMVEKLLKAMPFERVRELYETTSSSEVRKDIVHYLRTPGVEAEDFLIARLDEPEHQFSALQSLGQMGSPRVGAVIQRFVFDPSPRLQEMAVTSLGRLRHAPALGTLIELLAELRRSRATQPSPSLTNLEYVLLQGIAVIGGPQAYEALRVAFQEAPLRRHIIKVLVEAAEPAALQVAVELVESHPEFKHTLAKVISGAVFSHGHGLVGILDTEKPGAFPSLMNETALSFVLDVAREVVASGKVPRMYDPLTAVAAFHLPRARAFLEDLASREAGPEPEGAVDFIEPVLHARSLLGELGDPKYRREAVERELSERLKQPAVSGWDIERVMAFPREMAREALLRRIHARQDLHRALFLFRWLAVPEDQALFEALEKDPEPSVADLAHGYLADPRSFRL